MGIIDRVKMAGLAISGQLRMTASWNWRRGTKTGSVFNGSKISGKKLYPSAFDMDVDSLRDAVRASYWDSSQSRAIIKRLADHVVSTGLFLEYSPSWELINTSLPDDEKDQFIRDIEIRFGLWAKSKEADSTAKLSFYELQMFEFINRLRDGETFSILRYSGNSSRMNPVSIQFIDPAQVQTPYNSLVYNAAISAGKRIENGIEIDAFGKEVAIYVMDAVTREFTRIPVESPDGKRRYVLHPMISDTMGGVRGVSILGPVIHELKKIADYSVAELEAAVINAVLAVWVKPSDKLSASAALTGIRARGNVDAGPEVNQETREATFDRGGLIVQSLKAGEEVVSFDTKRPNVNYETFVRAITKHVSASVSIPIEVLEESFSANYSASRASLLLFYQSVDIWRGTCASQFNDAIFKAWFTEEVAAGRINAPGFGGASAYINAAWLQNSWMGTGKLSIDPLKEAAAVKLRQEMGHTTGEREAINYNNSDFSENARRLKIEHEQLGVDQAGQPIDQALIDQITNDQDKDNQ